MIHTDKKFDHFGINLDCQKFTAMFLMGNWPFVQHQCCSYNQLDFAI